MHPEGEKTRENPKGAKPTRDFPEFFHPKGAIISRIMSQSPRNVIIVTWQEIKLNRQSGLLERRRFRGSSISNIPALFLSPIRKQNRISVAPARTRRRSLIDGLRPRPSSVTEFVAPSGSPDADADVTPDSNRGWSHGIDCNCR